MAGACPPSCNLTQACRELGLGPDEVAELRREPKLLEGLELRFVMSHLASADEPDSLQNANQLAVMQSVAGIFEGIPVCFANSGGVMLGGSYLDATVRPGVALTAPTRERVVPIR